MRPRVASRNSRSSTRSTPASRTATTRPRSRASRKPARPRPASAISLARPRAVVSLGTNTTRLLVIRGSKDAFEQLEWGAIGTRLGEGLRDGGLLAARGRARTLAALQVLLERVRAHGAELSAIATSAMRRAADAAEFACEVEALIGVPLEVLGGEDEARYSFYGAVAERPRDGKRRAVLDIGGGSTECAAGVDGVLALARSVEIGSVRRTEDSPGLAGDTPGGPAHAAAREARAAAAAALAGLAEVGPVDEVIAVAGTPLTLAAIAFGTEVERVSGFSLDRAAVDALVERLLDLDLADRKALPGMDPQRADVLAGGGIVLSEALRRLEAASVRVEANDLLLGYLLACDAPRTPAG